MHDQDDHERIWVYTWSVVMGCAENCWITTCCLCRRLFEVRVGEQLMGKVTNIYRDRVWVDVGLIKGGSCSDSQNVLADKCRSDMPHGANWVRVPHIKEVRVISWRSWCSCRLCWVWTAEQTCFSQGQKTYPCRAHVKMFLLIPIIHLILLGTLAIFKYNCWSLHIHACIVTHTHFFNIDR